MSCRISLLLLAIVQTVGLFAPCRAADDKPPAVKELPSKMVDLAPGKAKLSDVLKRFKSTAIDVQAPEGADPEVTIDKEKAGKKAFWEALESVARAADLRVSPYLEGGKVGLVKHPRGYREVPVSYSGPFRVTLKRIIQARDLEDGFNFSIVWLEIAWEPGFQAYYVQTQPENLIIQAGGVPVEALAKGKGQAGVDHRVAIEVDIRTEGINRQAKTLDKLEGTFHVVGSPKLVEFTFDKLAKGEKPQTKEGVTAELTHFQAGKYWELTIQLTYPAGAAKFESFQSWLINNQCFLVNGKGERIDGGDNFNTEPAGAGKTQITYRFADKRLTDPKDWKLVYRTPAQIVEVPVKFRFEKVPLPSND